SIAYIDNTAVYVFTYCSLLLDRSRYLRVHVGNFVNAFANSTSKCNSRLKIRLLSEVRQKPPVAV
ncbi:hypothetical protein, partial [Aeromonas caviae]|uniref:hypothetical protein n=1 Tax=Aeromonas caviae TaxID=648 RepID=UPI001FBA605D